MESKISYDPKLSKYYKQLLDPDQVVKPVGVPDLSRAPTTKVKVVGESTLDFDASGISRFIVRPEVSHTVLGGAGSVTSGDVWSPSYERIAGGRSTAPLYHVDPDGKWALHDFQNSLYHSTKSFVALSAGCGLPMHMLTATGITKVVFPTAANDPSGYYTGKDKPSGATCSSGHTVTIFGATDDATVNNIRPYVITVNTSNQYVKTNGSTVTGPFVWGSTIGSVTIPASTNLIVEAGIETMTAQIVLQQLSFLLNVGATADNWVEKIGFSDSLAYLYEEGKIKYRPVAMKAHLQFHGGDLYNGSLVVAPNYDSSDLIHDPAYFDSNLAKRIEPYVGKVKDGAFMHYFPLSQDSFDYRYHYRESDDHTGRAHLSFDDASFKGYCQISDAAGRNVKLVVTAVFEVMVQNPLFNPTVTAPDILGLSLALNAVAKLKSVHENSLHDILYSSAMRKVVLPIAAGLVSTISPPLAPAAAAGVLLAQQMLKPKPKPGPGKRSKK